MKYLVLICLTLILTGCSAKCIQDRSDCNGFEKGISKTLDIIDSVSKFAQPALENYYNTFPHKGF